MTQEWQSSGQSTRLSQEITSEQDRLKEEKSDFSTKSKKSSSFQKLFGFDLSQLKSWGSAITLMFRPEDPSSLAVARILYGKRR